MFIRVSVVLNSAVVNATSNDVCFYVYTCLTFKNSSNEVYFKYYSILWQFLLNYECLQEELTTLFVASHFLSAKVSPDRILRPNFGTQEKCPFLLNRGVRSIEVTDTKITLTYFFVEPNFLSPE